MDVWKQIIMFFRISCHILYFKLGVEKLPLKFDNPCSMFYCILEGSWPKRAVILRAKLAVYKNFQITSLTVY